MKTLVVFHSKSGTTRKVGEDIAKALGADVDEITPVNAKPLYRPDGKMDGLEMMTLVFQVMIKWKTALVPAIKDPADYDLVVVGTPTWGGNLSAPVRSYLSAHASKFKKVAFFCTMGTSEKYKVASQVMKVFGQMEQLSASPILTLAVSQEEADSERAQKAIKEFAAKIKK